jgi:hypothetical protein
MISANLPFMIGNTLRSTENCFRNITNPVAETPKKVSAPEENSSGDRFASSQNILVNTSGYTVQEQNSLFAEIDRTNNMQEAPQTIIAQRGYEAALKVFQTQDQIAGETLDIIA